MRCEGAASDDCECLRCHGAAGVGGPNVRIGDPVSGPISATGYFRYAIARGRGRTPMPSFAATLDPVAIDDLVARLRAFQAVGAEQAQRSPAAPQRSLRRCRSDPCL